MQHRRSVGEDEGDEDVERSLLPHSRQCRQDDLLWVPAEHFDDRRARHLLLIEDALEDRSLEDSKADPQAERNHHDADPERHAPSPVEELITRNRAEREDRDVGDEQTGRRTPLRPRGDEPAMRIGLGPLHRDQCSAAPFAANADPLDKADTGQDDRAPDAD